MSIKVVGFDGGAFSQYHTEGMAERFMREYLQLIFSGNYPTGGDALDLTNAGGTVSAPTTVPPAVYGGVVDFDLLPRGVAGGFIASGGFGAIVVPNLNAPLKFADLANLKLKLFTSGNTEVSAAAYPANVLADLFILEVVYLR